MDVSEICPGLWRWTAPHPAWRGATDWPEDVGCVYYEAPDAVVLVDPLVPRDEEVRFWDALDRDVERAGRPVAVLLTAPWHERSAPAVVERYGASVWCHEAGARRLSAASQPGPLPQGVDAFVPDGIGEGEVAFLLSEPRTLVVGEFLAGDGGGLRLCRSPALWDELAFDDSLAELLDLPIERVLVSHGDPVLADGRARIAEALGRNAT